MDNKEASAAYRKAYNEGHEIIPDYAYDSMFGTDGELEDIGQGTEVAHLHPMLSLPTFFMDLETLTPELVASTGLQYGQDITVSQKLDGVPCSCILSKDGWVRAVSRGKRFKGFVVSKDFLKVLPQPIQMPKSDELVDFRGEFVISKKVFEVLNSELPKEQQYANPRSMVSAQINSLEPNPRILQNMRWFAHGIWKGEEASDHFSELKKWLSLTDIATHITLPAHMAKAELIPTIRRYYSLAMNDMYPCDGIVVQYRSTVDNDGRCNLDRIAIKQFDEAKYSGQTSVERIEWRLANNGSYFPRLLFKPVIINGAEVTHAAGYCWDYLKRMGLSVGSEVIVTMRGGVIPYVSKTLNIGTGNYMLPEDAIEPAEGEMQLWSSKSDMAIKRLKFIRGMEMLDLDQCGIQLFSDMFDAGYTDLFKVAEQVESGIFTGNMLTTYCVPNTDAGLAKCHVISNRFKTFNYVWLILALRENGIGFKAANVIGQHLSGYELKPEAVKILGHKDVKAFLAKPGLVELVKIHSKPVAPEHADMAIIAGKASEPSGKLKACMSKKPTNGMKKADFAATYLRDYDITENIAEAQMLVCPAGENSNKIRYARAHNIEIHSYESFINA